MQYLEQIVGLFFGTLWSEGNKLVKIRALIIALKILEGWRKITLVYFSAFLASVVFTAACFSALIYNLMSPQLKWDIFNSVTFLVGLISFFFLLWNLSEKRWCQAFGLDQELQKLMDNVEPEISKNKKANIDENQIEQMLERIVERKLNDLKVDSVSMH